MALKIMVGHLNNGVGDRVKILGIEPDGKLRVCRFVAMHDLYNKPYIAQNKPFVVEREQVTDIHEETFE